MDDVQVSNHPKHACLWIVGENMQTQYRNAPDWEPPTVRRQRYSPRHRVAPLANFTLSQTLMPDSSTVALNKLFDLTLRHCVSPLGPYPM